MNLSKKNSFFIVSVALHVSVFLMASLSWNLSQQKMALGDLQSTTLASYIYQESFLDAPSTMNKIESTNSVKKTEKLHKHEITMVQQKKFHIIADQQKVYLSKKAQPMQLHKSQLAGNDRPLPALVTLLHAAIQKQQRYPASAWQMEREGNTTVTFILFPSGLIAQLKITKSSGTPTLDEAAIAAIHNALPFKGIDKYLGVPQAYQITVAFELG